MYKENALIKYKDNKKIIINPKINNSNEIILNSINGNSIKIDMKDPKVPDGKILYIQNKIKIQKD